MRFVVVGNTESAFSLETYLLEAAQRLDCEPVGVGLTGSRLMLTPKVPSIARRLMWDRRLTLLARELQGLNTTRDGLLVLVKCAPLLNHPRHLSRVLRSWRGRVLLVAPDTLSSFCQPEALRLLVESGAKVGSFDTQAEEAEHGDWLSRSLVSYAFGYSPIAHWRPVDSTDAQTIDRVVFCGSWDAERERVIAEVGRTHEVAVYGPYWHRSRGPAGVHVVSDEGLFGQSQAAVVSRHAVALNIPRAQNLRTGNMRTFETPAQGGMQANAYGEKVLHNGIWATQLHDLAAHLERWLRLPRRQRIDIVRSAQAEAEPYSYEKRLRDLLDAVFANDA